LEYGTITIAMKIRESKNQLPTRTDLQIWAELKKGSILALGSLYDLYVDDLFLYGIQYSKDKGYVMDSIHDLFFDLYKYRTKLAMTDNVKSYLLKSLQRKINKKYSRKIKPLQGDYPLVIIDLQTAYTASFEEDIIRTEKAIEKSAKLKTALQSLTKKQKKGLFLRFNQGKPYEEIAEIMDVSINTARTTIYRALKALKKHSFSIALLAELTFF